MVAASYLPLSRFTLRKRGAIMVSLCIICTIQHKYHVRSGFLHFHEGGCPWFVCSVLVAPLLIARIVRFDGRLGIFSVSEDCGRSVCYGRFPRIGNLRVESEICDCTLPEAQVPIPRLRGPELNLIVPIVSGMNQNHRTCVTLNSLYWQALGIVSCRSSVNSSWFN